MASGYTVFGATIRGVDVISQLRLAICQFPLRNWRQKPSHFELLEDVVNQQAQVGAKYHCALDLRLV